MCVCACARVPSTSHPTLTRRHTGSPSWKHDHGDSVIHLEHADSETHHRKTVLSVDGQVHFEHHTDHFEGGVGSNVDAAPRLCSPVCDCVLDKDNNCVTDRLKKLGLLNKEEADEESRYTRAANEL